MEPLTEQPDWCRYPGAMVPMMGCYSLLGGHIRTEKDCGSCECRKSLPEPGSKPKVNHWLRVTNGTTKVLFRGGGSNTGSRGARISQQNPLKGVRGA